MSKEATGVLDAWLSLDKTMDQVYFCYPNWKSYRGTWWRRRWRWRRRVFPLIGPAFQFVWPQKGSFLRQRRKIRSCKLNFYSRLKFESTNIPNCVVSIAVWNNGQRNVLLGAYGDRDIRNKEGETIWVSLNYCKLLRWKHLRCITNWKWCRRCYMMGD